MLSAATFFAMTRQDLSALRVRLGWSREQLARRLDLSVSRLIDYEAGETRGNPRRRAPIPKMVELALRWLEEHERPLSPAERAALWSDDRNLPLYSGPPIDDRREALYDEARGG